MSGDQFTVSPAELTRIGRLAETVGQGLRRESDALTGPGRAAAGAHPGWAISGALTACADGWHTRVTGLADQLALYGDRLERTGQRYAAGDARIAAALDAIRPAG